MKNKVYQLCLAGMLLFSSCGDFLEESSQDKVYATGCADLNELMIGNGYMAVKAANMNAFSGKEHYYPFLYILDDDAEERAVGDLDLLGRDAVNRVNRFRNTYTWQQSPYRDIEGKAYDDDDTFAKLYNHIAVLNVVIKTVDEFPNDPEELRNRVLGEAFTLRGAYYYLLANIYGLPYAKATATKDLSVPLKLTEKIDGVHFGRNTTGEVFKQIVEDLKRGVELLKGVRQPTYYRVDERGARLLLSRVYLYMEEWKLVQEETSKLLELGCPLRDLRTEVVVPEKNIGAGKPFPSVDDWLKAREYMHDANSKEILFTMGSTTLPLMMMHDAKKALNYKLSDDLLRMYRVEGAEDLRMEKYFFEQSPGNILCLKNPHSVQARSKIVAFETFLLRSAEVYLNKAEAESLSEGGEGAARATLKTFMETRYATGKLPNVDELTGEKLVNFIRDERRRELCFECHRWFDLRRYAVASKYPLKTRIRHNVYFPANRESENGQVEGYYELLPYGEDKAWVMPFPEKEIIFNDGALLDNLRDERKMIK